MLRSQAPWTFSVFPWQSGQMMIGWRNFRERHLRRIWKKGERWQPGQRFKRYRGLPRQEATWPWVVSVSQDAHLLLRPFRELRMISLRKCGLLWAGHKFSLRSLHGCTWTCGCNIYCCPAFSPEAKTAYIFQPVTLERGGSQREWSLQSHPLWFNNWIWIWIFPIRYLAV